MNDDLNTDTLTPSETKYLDTKGQEPLDETPVADSVEKQGEKPQKSADKTEQNKDQNVPLAALLEERQHRKRLQERHEQDMQRVQTRLDQLFAGNNTEPKEKPVAYEDDPLAHFKQKTEATDRQLAEFKAWKEQNEQRAQGNNARNQFVAAYRAAGETFRQTTPDFDNGYKFLIADREKELADLGIDDPNERDAIIAGEEEAFAYRNLKAGRNPAEAFYRAALRRGFKPAEYLDDKPANGAANKIDTIAKGQQAAASLGNAGDKTGATGGMSAKQLAEMSEHDFAKISKRDFRRAMGG